MACIVHHLGLGHCTPPMYCTVVISFSNNHTRIAHLEHDHSMNIIIYPQDIPNFYILKCKRTRCVHPGRQSSKCRIAEYKSESYAAHCTDTLSINRSAFPIIISCRVRIRLIVSPGRPLLIRILSL